MNSKKKQNINKFFGVGKLTTTEKKHIIAVSEKLTDPKKEKVFVDYLKYLKNK